MITPSPTGTIAPTLVRGTLQEIVAPSATRPGHIVLAIPNTSYQVHLLPTAPIDTPAGKRIVGTVRADARRVDRVDTGGSYVEPVFGRPRRVQGRVLEIRPNAATIVVDAGGVPVHLHLTAPGQTAASFAPGELVSCSVLEGATFTPTAG